MDGILQTIFIEDYNVKFMFKAQKNGADVMIIIWSDTQGSYGKLKRNEACLNLPREELCYIRTRLKIHNN
jgi:hypothetical protein